MARLALRPLLPLLAALLILTPAVGAPPPAERAGGVELTVRVKGLKNDRGQVAVALFDSAASFPRQERALRGQVVRIAGGRSQVTFAYLQPGTYAVAILHDENQNQKMDFNFLGMPLEGYGFSNDASALFGPPSFERAAFRLLPRASAISINGRYF